MEIEDLRRAGELLLGPEWKRPLAKLLGPHFPSGARESLDPRLPFRWASGERPVPGWVPVVLSQLLIARGDELVAQGHEAKALARGLAKIARTGPLDDGPPDDGVPLGGPGDYRPDDDDPDP